MYENQQILIIFRATIFQHEMSKFDKVNTQSVAKPGVMRAGPEGKKINN